MGNQPTPSEKLNHPRLGSVSLVDVEGKKYMQYVISVHHEQQQKEWEDVLRDIRGKKEFEGMFLPLRFEVEKVPCGISRNLKALYPYFPYSLASEIENRVQQDAPFEEKELQYLLFELIDLAKEFEKVGKKAGNFKPDNILINQDGEVSFLCQHSYPGFTDGYIAALYDKEPSLLAPEEMHQLETSDEEKNVDQNKAEAFSIGMTVLSTGLLQDLQPAYNFKNGKFNEKKFYEFLTEWRKHPKYSAFFKDVVEKMLRLDPVERFSSAEMRSYLAPYEGAVKTLTAYEPNVALSEHSLYQYRQAKAGKKQEEQSKEPKGIRHLGAKFSKTNRESANPMDFTATKPISFTQSGPLTSADSVKTARESSFLKSHQAVFNLNPINTQPISFYAPAPGTFAYTPSSSYPHYYQYPQQPPQPLGTTLPPIIPPQPQNTAPTLPSTTLPTSSYQLQSTAGTTMPGIPVPSPGTLPSSPAFVSPVPASPTSPAIGGAFTTAPVVALETKEQNTSVQEMLKEFKAELSGQKQEGSPQTHGN